jgi:hypothetical protein
MITRRGLGARKRALRHLSGKGYREPDDESRQ